MSDKKKGMPKRGHITPKQADAMQDKLRAAIIAVTKHIDRNNVSPGQMPYLKKYRKMLMDANNYFGWSVRTHAYDAPSKKRQIQ